jgi:hypothetical protein
LALAQQLGFTLIAQSKHPDQQDLVLVNETVLKERTKDVQRAIVLARINGSLFTRCLQWMT